MNRLHPQDLRAIVAGLVYADPATNAQTAVKHADTLLAELERTAKPEALNLNPHPCPDPGCDCPYFHDPSIPCRKCGHAAAPEDDVCPICNSKLIALDVPCGATACRTCSKADETAAPETPLFSLVLPSDVCRGGTDIFQFTASSLARMAVMEKEGKILGRIAQDNRELRAEVGRLKADKALHGDELAYAAAQERERIIALLLPADPEHLTTWFGGPDGHAEFNEGKIRSFLEAP